MRKVGRGHILRAVRVHVKAVQDPGKADTTHRQQLLNNPFLADAARVLRSIEFEKIGVRLSGTGEELEFVVVLVVTVFIGDLALLVVRRLVEFGSCRMRLCVPACQRSANCVDATCRSLLTAMSCCTCQMASTARSETSKPN